jgi:cytochrome c oxidase cbb3-type subunit 3
LLSVTGRRAAGFGLAGLTLLLFSCLWASALLAEDKPLTNPKAGNPAAIKEGSSLFRGNCSPCHGMNATGGGRGPDLIAGRWAHGSSDAEIFHTISQGVPGTEMPANSFEDSETWAIIAYLRSVGSPQRATNSGDRTKGEKLFFASAGCSQCHMVKGKGGRLGPDLSRVGAARSESYLVDSIRDPDKQLSNGMLDPNRFWGPPLLYEMVTVVTASGERITGVAKNEDTFSIQLLDTSQQLRLFSRKDLKEVIQERKSLMPTYSREMLNPTDLHDLVSYLESLNGD